MKLWKIVITVFCIVILIPQTTFAIGNIFSVGENWETTGKTKAEEGTTMDSHALQEASESIYDILLVAATVVAILVGAFMGIQFMTAGIDKKVQVKESLFPYIVSCIVVFGSLGIWKLVVTIMNEIK